MWASQVALVVRKLPANARDMGSTPKSGRPLGDEHGNPLEYSQGTWWATGHEVAKSQPRRSDLAAAALIHTTRNLNEFPGNYALKSQFPKIAYHMISLIQYF